MVESNTNVKKIMCTEVTCEYCYRLTHAHAIASAGPFVSVILQHLELS